MAACGSLRHLFDTPRPENPTLMESLSWSQINAVKHAHDASSEAAASFAEVFGELHHFEERRSDDYLAQSAAALSPELSDRCPPSGCAVAEDRCRGDEGLPAGGNCCYPSLKSPPGASGEQCKGSPRENGVSSRMRRSESLRLCTEGLGSESSDVLEDSRAGPGWDRIGRGGAAADGTKRRYSRTLSDVRPRARGEFPPPISCIGSGGRPWVSFRSYRADGRFVLREVKIPTQELLRASREGGRLKLQFVQPEEEVVEEGGPGEEGDGAGGGGEEGGVEETEDVMKEIGLVQKRMEEIGV